MGSLLVHISALEGIDKQLLLLCFSRCPPRRIPQCFRGRASGDLGVHSFRLDIQGKSRVGTKAFVDALISGGSPTLLGWRWVHFVLFALLLRILLGANGPPGSR